VQIFRSLRAELAFLWALALSSCSIVAIRPRQEMADTAAAIRAAREVNAQTAAPEFYREAEEWYFKARQEYRLKNFKLAKDAADRARAAAEKAEFQAILGGAQRGSLQAEPQGEPQDASKQTPSEGDSKPASSPGS
jgi:hypothetical protein